MSDVDARLAHDLSVYGCAFEYVYADAAAMPKSAVLEPESCAVAYDDTVEHLPVWGITFRRDADTEAYDLRVCGPRETAEYRMAGKKLERTGAAPHAFGGVPLIEYRNNFDGLGDFEPVLSLIEAYSALQTDRVNDKRQLVDAILYVKNADLDAGQVAAMRDSRVISGIPADAKVGYLTKSLQEAEVDILRQSIEDDLHKAAMVPDLSDKDFAGNSSGVAIRYKLLAFEQLTANKETACAGAWPRASRFTTAIWPRGH